MTNENIYNGLSDVEAERILKKDGYNELPSQTKQGSLVILIKVLSEPMLLLLIGCGAVYLFMGEINDAFMLLVFVFVVIGITFYQERKTERTLEALRDISSPRAIVIRGGEHKRIAGREVVCGDIIVIREGDRVSADAAVLAAENLCADESLLTGEAVPVRKTAWDGKMEQQRPGGDDLPFVYSGSLIVSGHGIAQVKNTALNSEIGMIGKSLEEVNEEDTLLHKETAKIVRWMALISLVLCSLVVVLYALTRGNLLNGFLAGLTLAMAMLPEEFPVVLLVFMTLGAWRISKNHVLTRKPAAIETLGAATVLCTDKTGTLTMNKMKLSCLYAGNTFYEPGNPANSGLSEECRSLLEYGILASQPEPYDPIEKELKKAGDSYLRDVKRADKSFKLVKEYPLSKDLVAMSHAWQEESGRGYVISAKGAPEAIFDLCHMDPDEKADVLRRVKEMSDRGLRVLGVAGAAYQTDNLPANQHDFNFIFTGLIGFIDPIRPSAPNAVREAYEAGMRVIMITGDYPGTARFIARQIGIKNPDNHITGEELGKLGRLELQERIKTTNIFARVLPEQKLLIVNALKANNEIAAMTGDGVNDAPALKSAHIGIAMGERGTDVAREASSLVLLDDDFSSIVKAVRLGRRIYDNLKRAMGYILAVHVPIAGMSILPIAFGLSPVLLPAHIAFLELIIDPACSMVFESEKEARGIMKRPPRNPKQPIFNFKMIAISLLQGLGVLAAVFILYAYVLKTGKGELEARTFAFTSLVLANLMLIAVNLSWSRNIYRILLSANKILLTVFGGAFVSLLAVLYIPFFSGLFHLTALHLNDFVLIIVIVMASLAWFEVLKILRISKLNRRKII